MAGRILGLVFNDVDAAGRLDVHPEGPGSVAVPLHLLSVKLLEVKHQFADAAFVIRHGGRIAAQEINDVELVLRFFQRNAVFQNIRDWNFAIGQSGRSSEKEKGEKNGGKPFQHDGNGMKPPGKGKEIPCPLFCRKGAYGKGLKTGYFSLGTVLVFFLTHHEES